MTFIVLPTDKDIVNIANNPRNPLQDYVHHLLEECGGGGHYKREMVQALVGIDCDVWGRLLVQLHLQVGLREVQLGENLSAGKSSEELV